MEKIIDYDGLLEANDEGIIKAAEILCAGKLVAFPTETVYGLGANALDADAVISIFTAKGRPLTDPLIVHIVGMKNALELVDFTNAEEKRVFISLGNIFWPGPLTMIVKAASCIPSVVTAGTGFVGIRYPSHPIAIKLLEKCALPIAAPSANRFGHVSPTRASHVVDDLGSKGVTVLNGDDSDCESCEFGIESTVLKLDATERKITIFRQGAISKAQIEAVLAEIDLDFTVEVAVRRVNMHAATGPDVIANTALDVVGEQAPGQALTHYAPDVPCYIVSALSSNTDLNASLEEDVAEVKVSLEDLSSVAIIDFNGSMASISNMVLSYYDLSDEGNCLEAARKLFNALRVAEESHGVRHIYLPNIIIDSTDILNSTSSSSDIAPGLVDRIFRAASGRNIRLRMFQN